MGGLIRWRQLWRSCGQHRSLAGMSVFGSFAAFCGHMSRGSALLLRLWCWCAPQSLLRIEEVPSAQLKHSEEMERGVPRQAGDLLWSSTASGLSRYGGSGLPPHSCSSGAYRSFRLAHPLAGRPDPHGEADIPRSLPEKGSSVAPYSDWRQPSVSSALRCEAGEQS